MKDATVDLLNSVAAATAASSSGQLKGAEGYSKKRAVKKSIGQEGCSLD